MTEFLTKRRMKVVEEAKDTLILKMSGHRRVLYIVLLKEKKHAIHYLSDIHESIAFFLKKEYLYICLVF